MIVQIGQLGVLRRELFEFLEALFLHTVQVGELLGRVGPFLDQFCNLGRERILQFLDRLNEIAQDMVCDLA